MSSAPRVFVLPLLLAVAVTSVGCYHTRVETGLTPGAQSWENDWAPSFVYGLVPPPTVEAGAECPNGVAVVETKISFLNGLVSALTLSIFTPMTIEVTCAAGDMASAESAVEIAAGASLAEVQATFGDAAARAAEMQAPVRVRFMP
jgi:hypothetical protein